MKRLLLILLMCLPVRAEPEVKRNAPGLYRIKHSLGDVVIGKPNDFKPRAKLNRWDGECFIDVSYPTNKSNTAIHANGKVKWQDDDVEVVMYPKSEDNFEFEVILKARPQQDFVTLDIYSQGLVFHYQPALTVEEIAEGAVRPDNIVGSYAVYHKTRRGGQKYKSGKAFHIYRPELIDANGNRKWAEMLKVGKKLKITMDSDWLDNAVYPVVVDPTVGYTTIGGSTGTFDSNTMGGMGTYSPTSSGDATSVSVYIASGTSSLTLGIYDDTGAAGLPGALLGDTDAGAPGGVGWHTRTLDSTVAILSTSDYYFGYNSVGVNNLAWDSAGPADLHYKAESYVSGTLTDPFPLTPSVVSNRVNSIYATYTESGGGEIRAFEPGATTCFSVVRETDGDVWYVVGQVFEVWGTGARTAADYDIALVDKSGGMFVGTMDANIGAGQYYIVSHYQVAGAPADTDPAVFQEYGDWDGTTWTPSTITAGDVWEELIADHTAELSFGGEVGGLDPNLTLVLADTDELQTDWTNGGRLDLLLDAVKAITDRIPLIVTTVDTPNDANEFFIASAADDSNDAYVGSTITIQDVTDSHYESRYIVAYTGSTREVSVDLPFTFTPAASDPVWIWSVDYLPISLFDAIARIPIVTHVINTVTGGVYPSSGTMTRYDQFGDDP